MAMFRQDGNIMRRYLPIVKSRVVGRTLEDSSPNRCSLERFVILLLAVDSFDYTRHGEPPV